jgi:hypothetical protein
MTHADPDFWRIRLEDCRKALRANNFAATIVESPEQAREMVLSVILPCLEVKTVSWTPLTRPSRRSRCTRDAGRP